MENPTSSQQVRAIFKAGLIVGTLDIVGAFISASFRGVGPTAILKYIASAAFGAQAFSDGWEMIACGLLFHFVIAFAWTILFFILYRRFKSLFSYSRILTAIGYGLLIWSVMNVIVLPLTRLDPHISAKSATIGSSILIVAIGFPLTFLAEALFSRSTKNNSSH